MKVVELRCPRCGAQVDEQTRQCKYCGASLLIVEEQIKKGRKKVWEMSDKEIVEEAERIAEELEKEH